MNDLNLSTLRVKSVTINFDYSNQKPIEIKILLVDVNSDTLCTYTIVYDLDESKMLTVIDKRELDRSVLRDLNYINENFLEALRDLVSTVIAEIASR